MSTILETWRRIDKWDFALATALLVFFVTPINAWRLRTIMVADEIENVGILPLFRIQFVSNFVAHGAPISAIADLARAAMLKLRFNVGSGRSVRIVFYERIIGALGAIVTGFVASIILRMMFSHMKIVDAQLLLWIVGLLALGLLLLIGAVHVTTRIEFINRLVLSITALGLMLRRPWVAFELLLASCAQILGIAAIYFILAKGMRIDMLWWHTVLFMPLIFFVSALPIFYQGWGGREAIVIATIGSLGHATSAEAVAVSIAFGVVVFIASLPGAVFWMMRPSMRKAIRSEIGQT